jgi:hypothetical protein
VNIQAVDNLSERQQKSADRLEKERWKDVALKIKRYKKMSGNE